MTLTHISLFTGIGGIDLAAEWAGFKTVLMVEWDAYCQKVLRKHWPNVPIIGDIKDVKGEKFRPITLITGGFPCQPVSHAGKRRGKDDDRWLWPEMLRVISEVRPTWVVAENVAGLINMGLNGVLSDLEGIGYEVQAFLIPACGVDAPHRRNRIFIVAYSRGRGFSESDLGSKQSGRTKAVCPGANRASNKRTGLQDVANTNGQGLQGYGGLRERGGQWPTWKGDTALKGIWESEPPVDRVASGIPSRVDRLKCLGNAVVPQQIYPILKAIADIERS